MGFHDATCPDCRERIGWFGKLTDKPDCPKCGHKPDKEKLAALEKRLNAIKFSHLPDPRWDTNGVKVEASGSAHDGGASLRIDVQAVHLEI